MVALVEKYQPFIAPTEVDKLPDFLNRELARIATLQAARDEVVCGSVDFASAATVVVTFATEQPDTSYHPVFIGDANETLWLASALAVGGFTVGSSNATSTATIHWAIFRDRDND